MERSIPSVIEEDEVADFSRDSLDVGARHSLDSLNSSSWRNENEDGSVSLSLNDDLMSRNGSTSLSRRSFETSSIFTSSFRQSIDDSLPSLGLNKLSIQKVSPLGPNSVFELIADVDAKRSKSSSLSPNVTSSRNTINIPSPTINDIPSVQLSKVEKASKEKFKEYLSDIGKEYENYSSNKQLNSSTLRSLFKKQSGEEGLLESSNELNTVPDIFFDEEFNLDDPRVFKQVTEGIALDSLTDGLQDKISSYLDTIEIHLVNEISKSSNSFFDALNDLNEINEKNVKTVKLIDDLKKQTEVLEQRKLQTNLNRLKLQQKRNNVSQLEQGLLQVHTIVEESKLAEKLFLQSDYQDCMNKIEEIEKLISGESTTYSKWPFPLQNLQNTPALSKVTESLSSLRSKTGQSYTRIFCDYLLDDLRSHYEEIDYSKTLGRLMEGTNYTKTIDGGFRSQLQEYIIGLSRSEEIATAFKTYEDHFVNDIKNIVRIFLPNEENISVQSVKESSSVASSSVSKPSGKSLSTLIKSLTPREFEDMLLKIYATVSEALRRLTVQQKLLLDLALSNVKEGQEELIMQLDIRDAINKTIEIIQIRMGKIISVRKDLIGSLRIDYFLRFFYINSVFLNECESISGLNFRFLPDIINGQVKQFNQTFHHTNLKKISQSIDTEEWKPLIVPHELQLIVNKIVDNEDLDAGRPWKQEMLHLRESSNSETVEDQEPSHKRSIVIGDKTFVANNSLLVLINIIKDIFILSSNFHHLSPLYEANVLELLKYYNGRVIQSVKKPDGNLDREKNLSVVGESLDCLQDLIHYIRVSFDNLDHDEDYEKLIQAFGASKGKIDSVNTIFE